LTKDKKEQMNEDLCEVRKKVKVRRKKKISVQGSLELINRFSE